MTTVLCRFTGGSMDGAVYEVPGDAITAASAELYGCRSWYLLDDRGAFAFCGFNEEGATVAGFGKAFSEAARREREAIEEATRARSCRSCGQTFGSTGAYLIHFETGEGSRCLPAGAYGQLIERDGVWCIRNSDVARR